MKKIFLTLVAVLCCVSTFAQLTSFDNNHKPKLAVVICVDGMQAEHLTLMWSKFGEGGFKRLFNNGCYLPNVVCNYIAAGSTADYASLLTGTVPYYHGITGDKIYNSREDETISIVSDNSYSGIGDNPGYSAEHLQAMTFTDAIKAADQESKVIAVALHPESAIMLGGHAADAAVWISDNGKVATSDYYGNMPLWASKMNASGLVDNYMASSWRPMYSLSQYRFAPKNINSNKNHDNCFYIPTAKGTMSNKVAAFRQTPYCNTLIKDMATAALKETHLGTDQHTDVLCIQFTANVVGHNLGEFNTAEREDLYLKLDQDISLLLSNIEQQVGLSNVLIMLSGTQVDTYSASTLQQLRITAGNFNAKRAMALLNGYLMSLYGEGRWVTGYYARHITLNKELCDAKGVSIQQVRQETANFMTEFEGVATAYTLDQIMHATGSSNDILVRLRNSHYKQRSGDVVFTMLPGWSEVDTNGNQIGVLGTSARTLPVLFSGLNIRTSTNQQRLDIIDMVPTLCMLLQVPMPNAASGNPIDF